MKLDLKEISFKVRYALKMTKPAEIMARLIPEREKFVRTRPPEERNEWLDLFSRMDNMHAIKDFDGYLSVTRDIQNRCRDINKRFEKPEDSQDKEIGAGAGLDPGFGLSSGNSWRFFLNPFTAFSYFFEHEWAVNTAVRWLLVELVHDHYRIEYKTEVSEERKLQIAQAFKDYKIWPLFLRVFKHQLVYGNAIIRPKKSLWPRNLMELELWSMDRAMPIFKSDDEKIIGWEYWTGSTSRSYPLSELLHLGIPSLKYPQVGLPPCSPLAVDLESSVAASSLNANVLSRACMVGVILALKSETKSGRPVTQNMVKRILEELRNGSSGAKGANTVFASTIIENVHKLFDIGKFDASYPILRETIGRAVAAIYMISAARLNLSAKSAGVYESVQSNSQETDDKAIYAWVAPVFEFFNEQILPLVGLGDVRMIPQGRYGSLTLKGSQAGYIASQTGPIFTVNDIRELFYGLPPLPQDDPRGLIVVDNSTSRDPMLLPLINGKPTTDVQPVSGDSLEVNE